MSQDDYVFAGPEAGQAPPPRDNNPPLSISELSFALKRTLEDRFGHVRLRGEISKVNRHGSGHVYLTLKDERACIDGVVWKGQVRGLGVQPATGLEVIVTGKITSYPARSSYQIVIETMEAAGAGALLAQLERLKARLSAEGLFDAAKKAALPAYPAVIGVVTSPTGAVVRDILHRIAERWPCRVLVWPVVVQGEAACGQVSRAIRGFDGLAPGGAIPRPDLLIVARGGGSVEDLWCFNDEGLARTVAQARIPIVSAVGHETDTTLIDFVADRRAPTPTGAAEMATPVLADLRLAVADLDRRLIRAGDRLIEDRRVRLRAAARGLPLRPEDLFALAAQRLDLAASRLDAARTGAVAGHDRRLAAAVARLGPSLLKRTEERGQARLASAADRLQPALRAVTLIGSASLARPAQALRPAVDARIAAFERGLGRAAGRLGPALVDRRLDQRRAGLAAAGDRLALARRTLTAGPEQRLAALTRALGGLDPDRPRPGFARVETTDGARVAAAADLTNGQAIRLVFPDAARDARIDDDATGVGQPPRTAPRRRPSPVTPAQPLRQGDLF